MKRELKTVKGGYLLITDDETQGLRTEKKYKKTELKEIHCLLTTQIQQARMQKADLVKNISKLQIDDSPQLREFATKVKAAITIEEYDKLNEQLKMVREDLDTFAKQKLEIEAKIPEFKRKIN